MASPTTIDKVLIDLSTNDILLGLSKDEQLKEQELRRKVSSTNAKLEAAKKQLVDAEKAYYEASDDWNAAREQPNIPDGQLNYLWEQCEDNRKRMQPVKILAKKIQEEADLANVAMRDFENQAIQAKLRDTQLAFSVNPTVATERPTKLPHDPRCTCDTSIIDCEICFSLAGNKPRPRPQHVKKSSTRVQMRTAKQGIRSAAGRSKTGGEQGKPAEVPRFRNKYGDIPNHKTQMKAARRRLNQDLRQRDPELYREIMIQKKIIRDEKLRALREQQHRRRW